jgi:hypothetical protein
MKTSLSFCALLIILYSSAGCAPTTQVTNNSGFLIQKVLVDDVVFTENLNSCADGCSTAFIKVPRGNNCITLQKTSSSDIFDIGELGLFKCNKHYSVNIITNGGRVCAELWHRLQTDSTFNDDTTRVMIGTVCQ